LRGRRSSPSACTLSSSSGSGSTSSAGVRTVSVFP